MRTENIHFRSPFIDSVSLWIFLHMNFRWCSCDIIRSDPIQAIRMNKIVTDFSLYSNHFHIDTDRHGEWDGDKKNCNLSSKLTHSDNVCHACWKRNEWRHILWFVIMVRFCSTYSSGRTLFQRKWGSQSWMIVFG